jgi:ketosteroid isomerase-like protein
MNAKPSNISYMKKITVAFLTLFIPVFIFSQPQSTFTADRDSSGEQQIKQLEFILVDLIKKGDFDTYAGYLTDDYIRIAANGTVSTKQQVLEAFKKTNPQANSTMLPHDLSVRVYGNTAIMRGILDILSNDGTQRTSIITKVFIRRNDKWYMASMQGTSLP